MSVSFAEAGIAAAMGEKSQAEQFAEYGAVDILGNMTIFTEHDIEHRFGADSLLGRGFKTLLKGGQMAEYMLGGQAQVLAIQDFRQHQYAAGFEITAGNVMDVAFAGREEVFGGNEADDHSIPVLTHDAYFTGRVSESAETPDVYPVLVKRFSIRNGSDSESAETHDVYPVLVKRSSIGNGSYSESADTGGSPFTDGLSLAKNNTDLFRIPPAVQGLAKMGFFIGLGGVTSALTSGLIN